MFGYFGTAKMCFPVFFKGARITVYNALFLPHLECASSACARKNLQMKLERIQIQEASLS